MARTKDLWWTTGARGAKRKTARHPDLGGDKTAKRYLAIWQDPDGRERTKAFHKKGEAQRFGDDQEADVRRGEYLDRDAGRVPLEPLAHKWLRLRHVGPASMTRYESAYRLHVAPTFGQRMVGSVKPSEVAGWLRDLSKTRGASVQQIAYLILAGVFDLAVADGVRRDNPARSPVVAKPKRKPPSREREAWPVATVLAVADACKTYRTVPLVAAGVGARQREAFGLALEDFDFAAGVVHIRRQVGRSGGRIVFKAPKGGKERTAPLPRGVAALVRMHVQAHPAEPYTLPWMNEDGSDGKPVTVRLLFRWGGTDPRTAGKEIRSQSFNIGVWKPALVAAGVAEPYEWRAPPVAREDGFHALRHWYSSTLQDAGVSLAGVMEFLGHSRDRAPLAVGVYGHVTDETRERARQAVDSALFKLRSVGDHGTVTELRQAKGS